MARSMLIMLDSQTFRNDFDVLNPPIACIAAHIGDEFPRIRHTDMVQPAIPLLSQSLKNNGISTIALNEQRKTYDTGFL